MDASVPAPSTRDRRLLYGAAFLRAVGTGLTGVLLGVYLARLGLAGWALGAVVAAGLSGAACAATVATFLGDRIGRRRLLASVTLLGAVGTLGVALASHPLALVVLAFLGMVNGMGKDRGAALILEQAALPATGAAEERTRIVAWYTMVQDAGHAIGGLLAGLPSLLAAGGGWTGAAPHRATLALAALFGAVTLALYARLGTALDAGASSQIGRARSRRSRTVLARLCALFAVDGLAGGFLTTALLSYFFFERFAVSAAALGALFFAARVLNAASHLGAAWLAGRIGLVNTMVFTHIPSSVLLFAVAFAPSFPIAAALFLLREALVEMDVPTRQSYVLAVVAAEERTFASGITNLVRLAAWAVAPVLAGALMSGAALHLPLVIGAAMKIAYDLLLWRAFRHVRPPEEER
jgi:MFS family permease